MRSIHGETKLIGLLGHNAHYTLSPAIHNRAVHLLNLDQVYVNFDLEADDVRTFLDLFWKLGGVGLNVTKPHKNLVASLLPNCPLPSVNTLVRTSSGWAGHSTDGEGFAKALKRIDVTPEAIETVTILGSGGAAQAILRYFLHEQKGRLKKIFVIRRSADRDQTIRDIVQNSATVEFLEWSSESLKHALAHTSKDGLCIQAATVSQSAAPALQDFVPAVTDYHGPFVDLIYDKPTALYFAALHNGNKAQDGLPMLIEQARLSQKLWWGTCASYEDLASAIKHTGMLK